tara:strand:+ start:12869 stop:13753 length:885 start_codon:yes stop_codon:yes gene_type:complete
LHPCSFDHNDITWFEKINLEKYTTIKLGQIGDLVEVRSLEALKLQTQKIHELNYKIRLVGWGANQVLHKTENIVFLKLDFPFDKKYLSEYREVYDLPASVGLNQLTATAIRHGLKGWEVFTGIPASLGGAICMNAGTSLGEIGELVESVEVLTRKGRVERRRLSSKDFSYRKNNFLKTDEIILSVVLRHKGQDPNLAQKIKDYLQYRKNTQPLGTKNCGSVFKNLDNFKAGQTIDSLGLKGIGSDDLKVSLKHANFIENSGNATSSDFVELTDFIKEEIERCTGQKFELEVKIY